MTARAKLLSYDPNGTDNIKMIAAYAVSSRMPNAVEIMAAAAGVAPEHVLARLECPQFAADAEAARINAEVSGKDIEIQARDAQRKLVSRISDQAEAVDAFEAAELLKPINRILENADRVRLAEREKDEYANLPTFQFNFINGIHATLVTEPRVLETIEVTPVTYENGTRGDA